jgi:outer membrane PBP1 activator LpoA protein
MFPIPILGRRTPVPLRSKSALTVIILAMVLSACGNKATEVKKPEEPALPEPKTGNDIDAAAEDAMQAAEKETDAKAEAGKAGKNALDEPKTGTAEKAE